MKKVFKWYLPFLIVTIIVAANLIYVSTNKSYAKIEYLRESDYSTSIFWDSIKILHDSNPKYEAFSNNKSNKIFLRSVIREITPKVIREDSLIMLTLCDDSLFTKSKNNIFKCFYIGPYDSEIFTIGNLVEIFGYKKPLPNTNIVYVKVDFIQKYSWFNELSRLGLSGIQILIFTSVLCILLFSYTMYKLLKNEN